MKVFFVLLTGYAGVLFGTIYYVAPWGDNDNPGTFDYPWQTIGKAATTMVAGDSVFIRGGTYQESINPANSGNASASITYRNYDNEQVVVEGGEEVTGWILDSGNRYSASVPFTPSPRFSSSRDPSGNLGGLILQDGAKMEYAMEPSAAAVDSPGEYYMNDSVGMGPPYTMYIYARDLGQGFDPNNYQMIVGMYRKGFDLDGGEDYQVVDGLTFRDYNDNAVHSIGSNSCVFKNMVLYSNFITGIYLTASSRNCAIEKCLFWDNGHGGIEIASSNNTAIKRNKFTAIDLGDGLGGNGAHMWVGPVGLYADSCLIENNIGFRTGSDYIISVFIYMNGSYAMIRHNSGIAFGMAGIALFDGGDNTVINNITDCDRGLACINVFPNAVADSGHFIQYNDFYAQDPTGKYRWNGILYNSLSEWQAASGQINNIDSLPGFSDPDSENLHLITDSDCIDAGTSVNASTEDYDGNLRPVGVGYDIGAYEYNPISISDEPGVNSAAHDILCVQNPSVQGCWIIRAKGETNGRIRIFDLTGRLVMTRDFLKNQARIFWNGRDMNGREVAGGNYFLVYTSNESQSAERKIIFLR